jgi:hypothetical protein
MNRNLARLLLLGSLLALLAPGLLLAPARPMLAQETFGLTPEPEPSRPPDPAPDPGDDDDDDGDGDAAVQSAPPAEIQRVLPLPGAQQATPAPTEAPAPTEVPAPTAAPAQPAPTPAPAAEAPAASAPRPGSLPVTAATDAPVTGGPLIPTLLFLAVLALFIRELLPLFDRRR